MYFSVIPVIKVLIYNFTSLTVYTLRFTLLIIAWLIKHTLYSVILWQGVS